MSARSRRARSRGSSIVEFALFLGVFIPIMLYALYITDALFDWLKAQDAVGSAAWELSGELLHDYNTYNHAAKYTTAYGNVSRVKSRYRGLDEWNANAPSTRITPMSIGRLTELSCNNAPKPPAEPLAADAVVAAAFPDGFAAKLHTGGLVQCQSAVSIASTYFGQPIKSDLADQKWGGKVSLFSKSFLAPITLCGVGPTKAGSCDNEVGFTLLTDDWGLSEDASTSSDASKNLPDQSVANAHFYALGAELFKVLDMPKVPKISITGLGSITTIENQINTFLGDIQNFIWESLGGAITLSLKNPSASASADDIVDPPGVGGPLNPIGFLRPPLDTTFEQFILAYEPENESKGPGSASSITAGSGNTGPLLESGSLTHCETGPLGFGHEYDQPSETYPDLQNELSLQTATNLTLSADNARTVYYLGLKQQSK